MKCRVKWLDHMTFVGESGSGHAVVMDGATEHGGRDMGFRPMEMLLLGVGGCTAFDVMSMLKKSRQAVTDCEVKVDSDRAEEVPKVFTRIHVHFIVSGKNLDPVKVEKAVKLSAEKYCSASLMLGKTAEMSHSFEVVEVG